MPGSFCRHSTKKRCVHKDVIGFTCTININEMDTQRHVWVYRKMRCIASCSIAIKFARHMERRKPFHFLHEFMVWKKSSLSIYHKCGYMFLFCTCIVGGVKFVTWATCRDVLTFYLVGCFARYCVNDMCVDNCQDIPHA